MTLLDEPNFNDWPVDDFFTLKQQRHDYLAKILEENAYPAKRDMLWLLDKTKAFYCLLDHAATNRVELLAEILQKDIEIQELQGKLDDLRGQET